MTKYKIGMAQMLVRGGEVEANLKRACEMIEDAAARNCKLVVLPECLDVGWTEQSARELAQHVPGPTSDILCDAAQTNKIFVVAGLTEREENHIYNTSILISPQGEILLKHRKINILSIAQDLYSVGNSLAVAETELGTIGISICLDNSPSSLVIGHSLARMGAQLLLSPCSWAMPPEHDNEREPYHEVCGWIRSYSELSTLFDMTVVGVSNVGIVQTGPWAGHSCVGSSLAYGPGGVQIAMGPYGADADTLLVIEVDPVKFEAKGQNIAEVLETRLADQTTKSDQTAQMR